MKPIHAVIGAAGAGLVGAGLNGQAPEPQPEPAPIVAETPAVPPPTKVKTVYRDRLPPQVKEAWNSLYDSVGVEVKRAMAGKIVDSTSNDAVANAITRVVKALEREKWRSRTPSAVERYRELSQ